MIYRTTDFLFVGFVFRSNKQLSESAVGLKTHVNFMFFFLKIRFICSDLPFKYGITMLPLVSFLVDGCFFLLSLFLFRLLATLFIAHRG